jgi:SAM-dependent methyltransferase
VNPVSAADPALAFTGERFTPEVRGAIWHEHWHRYVLARELVRGRRVLDAACGEGYGASLLAQVAGSVVGVDIAPGAIAHACEKYRADNLAFLCGSVTQLPLPDASVDVITSFETIEHLAEQEQMLREFRRVLAPQGVLVLSSPNQPVYAAYASGGNEYHVRELERAELAALLAPAFPQQRWYGQCVLAHSVMWAEGDAPRVATHVHLAADAPAVTDEPAAPMYFVVIAGAQGAALPAFAPLSLFDDGEQSWFRQQALSAQALNLELADARKIGGERLAELIDTVNALSSERQRADALAGRVAQLEAEIAPTLQQLSFERDSHASLRAHMAYRESLKGWLRWPFSRLKARLAGAG